ncbi:Polycomb group protein FIE1 [Coccomyxa sp. Obi]|nr:Polycomb group protein FIE1 [Coccomyxa sp. Obi]
MVERNSTSLFWNPKATNSIKEDHGKPIYCVTFNSISEACKDVFASCGGPRATIYKCLPGGAVEILQAYIDKDESEEFFACKWSVDTSTGDPLLLLAGKNGLLKILNCTTQKLEWVAEGHGDAINDIAIHPMQPSLVLTASRDASLRLWNTQTKVCVLIVNGDGGHRNEVLSIDFHPVDGNQFVSCGMDNYVKIWSLEDVVEHVESSFQHNSNGATVFATKFLGSPKFSSYKVHYDYVDCVRFCGDLLLTKSVHERIYMWRPDLDPEEPIDTKGHIHLVQELDLDDCAKIWFVRFAMDRDCRTLACGTKSGMVLVYDPLTLCRRPIAKLKRGPSVLKAVAPIARQTAVSPDGDIIVSCCEDSTIWRYDLVTKETSSAATKAKAGAQANGALRKGA